LNTRTLSIVLGGLAMVGPFATDTYLPAFPDMAAHYAVSELAMQQTLSVYLFGYAFMMLFYGTLSDSFGRRPIILSALSVFGLSSLGAAVAPSFEVLLVCRVLQGLSGGAGMVVGQAVVRDLFHGATAQRMLSNIMMVFGIAPAIAPVIGGYLNVYVGWQSNFVFLAGIGALLLVMTLVGLPESLQREERHPFELQPIVRNYLHAMTHRRYMWGVLAIAFAFSGLALYVSSAANFVIVVLKLHETAFAWLFVPMIGGMVVGSGVGGRLAHQLPMTTTVRLGLTIMTLAACGNLAYSALFAASIPWAVIPIFALTFGMALAMPGMSVMTQGLLPQFRGLAASLQNFVQMLVFAIISGSVAPALFGSDLLLAVGVMVGVILSIGCWMVFQSYPAEAPEPAVGTAQAPSKA
jgi:DHA1 family bicyclomycin/chloramphenicol resistance-like MFS transporter